MPRHCRKSSVAALATNPRATYVLCVRMVRGEMKIYKFALATMIATICCGATIGKAVAASSPATTPTANAAQIVGAPGDLGALIVAGNLADLRWPNFTDYRDIVKKFYDAGGNSLAWIQNGKGSTQAVSMILLFQQASAKGLNPEDYDASRWDARLAKLQPTAPKPSDADLAHIDLALTVSAMRYISDLHIGRVNPQHFKFGLMIGPKKYDLADELRTQILPASDIPTVIAKVEPHYDGYRRAEDALATYSKIATLGDTPLILVPQKGVRPGSTFAAMPLLVARLHQLGDLPSGADVRADATLYKGAV